MEQSAVCPIIINVSHESYRDLLDKAAQCDDKYPWVQQFRFLVSIATVGVDGVTLKLG